jgi:hypothetical protein
VTKNAEVPKSPKSTTKAAVSEQIVTPLTKSSSIAIAKPAMYVQKHRWRFEDLPNAKPLTSSIGEKDQPSPFHPGEKDNS